MYTRMRKIRVKVVTTKGDYEGILHVSIGVRMSDFLNNYNADFVPLVEHGGNQNVIFINRHYMVAIEPLEDDLQD